MKLLQYSLFVALCSTAFVSNAEAKPKPKLPSMAPPVKLTGIVAGEPQNGEFFLRANSQSFRVKPLPEVNMKSIKGGDRVRVWGRPTGLRVTHANVRVVQSRASDNPSDYDPAPSTNIERR